MWAYYNEIDQAACAILRQLIDESVIAPGDVDDRSIKEVTADDLRGYTQCHFFAGGGLWSVAARLAGWPDRRPLWTASCPCQPISVAGKRAGADDPRHLWPDLFRIYRSALRAGFAAPVLVGEQVAGSLGYNWFDGVRADLATEEVAARTVDFPASAVDAPHQRHRQYWIAVADIQGERGRGEFEERRPEGRAAAGRADASCAMADSAGEQSSSRHTGALQGRAEHEWPPLQSERCHGGGGAMADAGSRSLRGGGPATDTRSASGAGREAREQRLWSDTRSGDVDRGGSLDDADGARQFQREWHVADERGRARHADARRNGTFWSGAEWINCHDGKARRAEPRIRFLVNGLPGRVDLWRVGGNAIVPQAAAEVIAAFLDAEAIHHQ